MAEEKETQDETMQEREKHLQFSRQPANGGHFLIIALLSGELEPKGKSRKNAITTY